MGWIFVAGVAWIVAVLAGWLWSRPSGSERAVLNQYPPSARLLFFVPFTGSWQEMFNARDCAALSGLRKRCLQAVAAVGVCSLAWIAAALERPAGVASLPRQPVRTVEREVPAIPTQPEREAPLSAKPENEEAAPIHGKGSVAPEGVPEAEEPPDARRDSNGRRTVTLEDDKALSEGRRQVRLFGSANVKPIYDSGYRKLMGLQVNNVKPGSFWETLGIRNGDVILELNGRLIDDPEASIGFMNALSNEPVLHLRVRGEDGRERFLDYVTPE